MGEPPTPDIYDLLGALDTAVRAAQTARAEAAQTFTILSCGHGTTIALPPGTLVTCHGEGHHSGTTAYPVEARQ